jgi:hypothetical protein
MELVLLGVAVEGVPDIGDPERRTHWMIKLGPYEAHITEWNFRYRESESPPYKNYSYHLKIGSEYVLHSQSSVMTPEEAVAIIDGAMRKYLLDKRKVEEIYISHFANGR